MKMMCLEAIYPNLSKAQEGDKKYPYLLKGLAIAAPNDVWSTDITYIPLKSVFLYLKAIMDWFTRYIISWRLSNTLDVGFCLEALAEALAKGKPKIFKSDHGLEASQGLQKYMQFYNEERPHSALDYCTPQHMYRGGS